MRENDVYNREPRREDYRFEDVAAVTNSDRTVLLWDLAE